jgi:hypothetical protein
MNSIASTLIHFVDGNWDALEQEEAKKLTPSQLRNTIAILIVNTAKTLFIAALPIVGFIILQRTPYALKEPTLGTVVSILPIYAVTVITFTIDTNFSARVANVKDFYSLLPRIDNSQEVK